MVWGQATSTGSGQDYPSKTIRIITLAAGGGSEFTAVLKNGAEIVAASIEQFAAIMKSDMARMSRVIKEAGIKVE